VIVRRIGDIKLKVEWLHLYNLSVYCFLGAGRTHNIKIGNSSFERVEEFKYLGKKPLANDSSIQEENKSRLKSVNACYHSV